MPNLRKNFTSGLLVSFIALPLCIAIAIACDFPVFSGIFTAIIGGIFVSQISGSNVTINGPAAGMIVVILDAVSSLGGGDVMAGYRYTLGAIAVASLLQFATSFTKLPEIMRKFPAAIIRAMMMAIGLIVILKQIFVLLGFKTPRVPLLELFTHIPQAFLGMQIEVFGVGIFAIALIFFWKKYLERFHIFRVIPVYLVAIIFASALAAFLQISQSRHFLVQSMSEPVLSLFIALPSSIKQAFAFPDFSKIFSYEFLLATFSIFAVGSLETILSAIAVDKIDPQNRTTNLEKDLRAVGLGNLCCGLIGALPMIAEIVRSTANVKYGATNKWSNFFHGACLLVMVTIFSSLLKFIPLCVLAGMLILIGWTLINPKLLAEIFRKNKQDFAVILCVIFFTLYIDLLVGIGSGLVAHFLFRKLVKILKK